MPLPSRLPIMIRLLVLGSRGDDVIGQRASIDVAARERQSNGGVGVTSRVASTAEFDSLNAKKTIGRLLRRKHFRVSSSKPNALIPTDG